MTMNLKILLGQKYNYRISKYLCQEKISQTERKGFEPLQVLTRHISSVMQYHYATFPKKMEYRGLEPRKPEGARFTVSCNCRYTNTP